MEAWIHLTAARIDQALALRVYAKIEVLREVVDENAHRWRCYG
jgi:hypothetical protein